MGRLACHFLVLALVLANLYFCIVPYCHVQEQPTPTPPRVECPPGVRVNPSTLIWEHFSPPARAAPEHALPGATSQPEDRLTI